MRPRGYSMPRGLFFLMGGAETEKGKGIASGTIGALKARFPVLVNAESAGEKKRCLASPTLGRGRWLRERDGRQDRRLSWRMALAPVGPLVGSSLER